jgi:gas vesicle protein
MSPRRVWDWLHVMRKLTLSLAAVIAIAAVAALWKRDRQSVKDAWDKARRTASSWSTAAAREATKAAETASEIEHDLGDAARQASRSTDEVGDELMNVVREPGKAADAASEAADELKAAVESPPERTT